MTAYIELIPGVNALSWDDVEHVEIGGGDNRDVTYTARGTPHTIRYIDAATAQAAYDTFLLLVNGTGLGIEPGDAVKVSPEQAGSAMQVQFDAVVVWVPAASFQYWIVATNSSLMYMSPNTTVSKAL